MSLPSDDTKHTVDPASNRDPASRSDLVVPVCALLSLPRGVELLDPGAEPKEVHARSVF
jgi:hypothetical protein